MTGIYDIFKDTTFKNLSSIPSHWEAVRLKYLVSYNDEVLAISENDDFEINYIEIGDVSIERGINQFSTVKISQAASRARRIVKTNDIIISTVRTYLKAIAKIPSEFNGFIVSTGFIVLRSRKINPNFLHYIVQNETFIEEIISMSVGASYPAISSSNLLSIPVPFPSILEQIKIAQYLDHQTAIIDQLILQKEKLIELLKEKRQAIINEAVTKGLNPHAKMKDSGIEWLGEVPEEWDIIKLKFLIHQLESGVSVNSENSPIDINSAERAVLKTSCVFNYSFIPEENKKVVQEEFDRVQCPVRANSIIISRMNTPELVGASGYVERDYPNLFLPDRLWQTVFNDSIELDVEFLSFILKSETFRNLYGIIATGTSPSMKNISQNSFLDLPIPLPKIETQRNIKFQLREFDAKASITINTLEKSIEKLKEYRQSIISEAVTGKIDVRDWQPNKKQMA